MSGLHQMFRNGTDNILVSDAQYIELIGSKQVETQTISSKSGNVKVVEPSSRIVCEGPMLLVFHKVAHLTLTNISFTNCGARLDFRWINQQIIYDINPLFPGSALFFIAVEDLVLDGVLVQNSTGYGMIAMNNLNIFYILRSAFLHNHYGLLYSGGGALIIFANARLFTECLDYTIRSVVLRIINSQFMFGTGFKFPLPINRHDHLTDLYYLVSTGCAGLNIIICPTFYSVEISLEDLVVANNYASLNCDGNNLWIALFRGANVKNPIKIQSLVSFLNHDTSKSDIQSRRSKSVGYTSGMTDSEATFNSQCKTVISPQLPIILFNDSHFVHSPLGLSIVTFLSSDESNPSILPSVVFILKCSFSTNIVHMSAVNDVSEQAFKLYLNESTFSYSRVPHSGLFWNSSVSLQSLNDVHIFNCIFANNRGTAIAAVNSDLYFRGTVMFQNNTGYNGGGLALLANSFMHLRPNATTTFRANHAIRSGGAIYVNNKEELVLLGGDQSCFFQIQHEALQDEINVILENNSARVSGSAIYGGLMGDCKGTKKFGTIGKEIFNKIFTVKDDHGSKSVLATDPTFVHFCSNGNVTNFQTLKHMTFPGKDFTIELAASGRAGGFVPAAIISSISSPNAKLGALQDVQDVSNSCENLTYTIFTRQEFIQLNIRVGDYTFYFYKRNDAYLIVNITLDDCPVGFKLSHATNSCDCTGTLQNFNISCDINDETFERIGSLWLHGYPLLNETPSSLLVHKHCPFDYCNPLIVKVNLDNPDVQCTTGR